MKTGKYYMLFKGFKVISIKKERKDIINIFKKYPKTEQKNLTIGKEIFERRSRI